jgi:hypothetical protein
MRISWLFLLACLTVGVLGAEEAVTRMRAPAYPLIAHDPYFSVWQFEDEAAGGPTRHWTGTPQEIGSLIRVDGKSFRLLGSNLSRIPRAELLEAFPQTSVDVFPTRTVYSFAGHGVAVTLTFLTPALPSDLDVLARPATYVVWQVRSTDGQSHDVQLFFDASAHLVVNDATQAATWGRMGHAAGSVLRMGSETQNVLWRRGDNLRIDWGYLYVAAPKNATHAAFAGERQRARAAFQKEGGLPETDDFGPHNTIRTSQPGLSVAFPLGQVGAAAVERYAVIAYDDIFAVEFLHERLRPYWRRNGQTAAEMLAAALADFGRLRQESEAFDKKLIADLMRAGGEAYARIGVLAYRQTLAAHKLAADSEGRLLYFSKENFSNGCIGTVDVTYPSAPFALVFQPKLLEGMLEPVLRYASLPRWKFPFAPHDLGTYPLANGQIYGGGEHNEENQMPVEESGNMLILLEALARYSQSTELTERYWDLISRWAGYLKEKGLDPENQLSTDDFAGHLARNANLSLKAIAALASYARLAERLGKTTVAEEYRQIAQNYAAQWQTMAADGDHYVLAFGQPGTWSQKYNLVWDKLLGLDLFPEGVVQKEIAWYKKVQGPYGLPLDNREKYTKLDWIVWTATMAEKREDFEALIAPVDRFLKETPDRVPMTDWYWTHDAKQRGFQARSVVGGVFIKLLDK